MIKKTRKSRKARIRSKLEGSTSRPRLAVYRSNKYIYAQLIDDTKGSTLASAKGTDATEVGSSIAKLAKSKKINTIVFDRAGYKYHGKVSRLADAAREGGLAF